MNSSRWVLIENPPDRINPPKGKQARSNRRRTEYEAPDLIFDAVFFLNPLSTGVLDPLVLKNKGSLEVETNGLRVHLNLSAMYDDVWFHHNKGEWVLEDIVCVSTPRSKLQSIFLLISLACVL